MFGGVNKFINEFQDKYSVHFKDVLDVGSYDVNGSVRSILKPGTYDNFTGIDMRAGPGVDRVMNGHDICNYFNPESFDLVTCCETFEHDDKFWVTLENMRTVLKPGGWMVITVPGIYFGKHDFPSDFYRFTEEAVRSFFKGFTHVKVEYYENTEHIEQGLTKPDNSIFAYGRKPL